jgi:uncharacterized protein YndB with AHSA1/START domain
MWEYEHSVRTAAPAAELWRHWSDVPSWPSWNAGIEKIEIDGPFQPGTRFTMSAPGADPVTMRLTEVVPGESFTDQMDAGDFVVTTSHRIAQADGGVRITYRTEITGPAADAVGPELGPAITADFPDVLAALVKLAERDAA